jgi:hypothetical protein
LAKSVIVGENSKKGTSFWEAYPNAILLLCLDLGILDFEKAVGKASATVILNLDPHAVNIRISTINERGDNLNA